MKDEILETKNMATELFHFLLPKADVDVQVIMNALAMVLSTIAVAAGVREEKALYAFGKAYKTAAKLKKTSDMVH